MTKLKDEYSCALLLAMDLVGGKWKFRILWHILNGDNRFSLLQKGIPDITEKMLTTQLREMEGTGLVVRKIISEKPLKIEYEVSSKHKELEQMIESLCNFSKAYGEMNNIIINE